MSRSLEYSYNVAREKRREMNEQRVRNNTQSFYQQYSDRLRRMASQGYDNYIPREMNRLRSDLSNLSMLLSVDPFRARDVSMQIGSYIRNMDSLGYAAKQRFQESENRRRQAEYEARQAENRRRQAENRQRQTEYEARQAENRRRQAEYEERQRQRQQRQAEYEARQAEINARVAETTQEFYERYRERYDSMLQYGFEDYIPQEMQRLKSDLDRIERLLQSNPFEAKTLSLEVGNYIREMNSKANSARQKFEREEAKRIQAQIEAQKQEREHVSQLYFDLTSQISDPIVINLAVSDLQELESKIESGEISDENIVRKSIEQIVATAESKAEEWKKETINANLKKGTLEQIDEAENRLKATKIEDEEKAAEFTKKMQQLREELESDTLDSSAIESEISKIEEEVDETLITEEVRRETVRAIVKELRSQEFVVEPPQVTANDGKNYVKIVAKRPSGKRVICQVNLNGKIAYKFDNYEGMTCLKDIEQFNVDLERIYSIKLSDERVIWNNPDRLIKDAEQLPKNEGRNING